MGPQTRQAIRTFQTQQQLPPTGILDVNTVTALQAACNPPQGAQPPAGPPPAAPPDQGPPPPAGGGGGGGQRRGQQKEAEFGYEGEGEFRPERPFFRDERFREGRERWGGDRDRRWPWLFQEAESAYDGEAEFWPDRLLSRTVFDVHRDEGFREGKDRWRWDRDRRRPGLFQEAESGYGNEAEFWPERNVFRPFEFHRDERFREEGDRWRWDRDRQRPWLFREAESGYGMEGETRPERPASRPPADHGPEKPPTPPPPVAHVEERPIVRPRVEIREERPIVRPRVEIREERPIFRPRVEFRPERPVFRPPFEFHAPDRFRPAIDRFHGDRDRRWLGLERGRRDWAFGAPWDRSRLLWAQSCLAQVLGPWVVQDGILGPNTQAAVQAFQDQRQLPQTGVLDGNTVNALRAACGG
jgi:peptidoglycan hydrolase-like protein with peptidoglycan-binding domain